MADRIPLVIEGSQIREITSGDRLDLTGNALQVGGNITPTTDSAYDIGTSSLKFRDIYLSAGTIHLGGVKLKADGGSLSIQDSTGAASGITATSLGQISTDNLLEGSTNVFHTAARARNSMVAGTGVTYDSASGVISIGQPVGTTDSVTFDNLLVNGPATFNGYIDFRTDSAVDAAYKEGRLWYSSEYHTLVLEGVDSSADLLVGREIQVRVTNNSGSDIGSGVPVYTTGASGETLTIAPADASTETKARVLGVTHMNIPNGGSGQVVVRGLVSGLDTSGLTPGSEVHLGPSGGLQTTAPTYPNFPTEIGRCIVADASAGYLWVDIDWHTFEQFRVTGNQHIGGNLTIAGDLTVTGTQSIVSQANLAVDNAFVYLNSGDTIGTANTVFVGSGLDDADLTGHYKGTVTSQGFYVKIDSSGGAGADTFEWGYDSGVGAVATGVAITGNDQYLEYGINVNFNATQGHTTGDKWTGVASPVNLDTGFSSNRNTGASGVGYTHVGFFFDITDEKFKIFESYYPEPGEGAINTADSSYAAGTLVAAGFEGPLTGNVTGNASTATTLQTARDITLSGDVSGTASFNGGSNINISTTIGANSVALGTDTTGNYVGTITGSSTITSSGATSGEGIAHTLSVTAGSISSTQLASASTLTIKNTAGTTLKTVIGAGS